MLFNSLDKTTYKDSVEEIFSDASRVIPDTRATWNLKNVENYNDFSTILQDDDEENSKFNDDLTWLNTESITKTKFELDKLVDSLTQEFSLESTESDELNSELEIIIKKVDLNRIRLKILQKAVTSQGGHGE